MRQSSGSSVALPLAPNEASHITLNKRHPGNSTGTSTLFGSFNPTCREENPVLPHQPPQKPHLPKTITAAPCCMKGSSHGLGTVSGSTSMEEQRSIAQTPPLAWSQGKRQQSRLTLCTVMDPTQIRVPSFPKVTLSQPPLGNTPGPL